MSYLGTKPANALATTEQIGDGAVQTADIANSAVTQAKLASGVAGNGPAFSAYSSGNQALPIATLTKIQFQNERFDTNNNFDSATNYRFTPTIAGYYYISASVSVANSVNNMGIYVVIYKNGNPFNMASCTSNVNTYPSAAVSSVIYFNGSTDYVEVYATSYNQVVTTVSGGVFATGDVNNFSGSLVRSA